MWYLYLDESGDLGFNHSKSSKYFTITILAVSSIDVNRKLLKEVKLTIRRKLNPKNKRNRLIKELKGTNTKFKIKKYFYKKIKNYKFGIYSITIKKANIYEDFLRNKSRVYNWISRKVLDLIPFNYNQGSRVELIVDKSMGKPEIRNFNDYIFKNLEAKLPPDVKIDIYHWKSHENPGLQIVDLFCWGIFQKYERKNNKWYNLFKDKLNSEELYFKNKKPLSGKQPN
jgi:hypothetical protein